MATGKLRKSNRDNAGDFIGECSVTQSCEPCMKANVSKTATFFCNKCNEFLCDTCKNPHTVYKPGWHDIVNIQDRQSVPVGVDMKGIDICPEHGKEIEFFCKDHSKLCCSKCVLIHRKCDQVDEIASASGQERPKLQALQQSMMKLQSEADAIIADCMQSETGLNESIAKLSSEVDKMRDRIVQLFEEAKKKLMTDAKLFKSAEVQRITIKSESPLKVKEELYKVMPICCAVLEHGTPCQQYIFSKIIQEKNNTWQSIINEHTNLKTSSTVTVSFPRELSTLLEMASDFLKLSCNSSHPDTVMATGSHSLIVAAFDFGTTYSGYAYSFKDSPNDVKTNRNWIAGSGKLISLKTPTSVLLNEDGEFDSFGFDAEDKYSSLAEHGKHHGWRLFRRFMMDLHSQRSSRSATVKDLEGKTFPAKPIFTMSLKYLQKHLLDDLSMSKVGTRETDIKYIITVPAIWGIAAKLFMTEAAIEAGIDGARLKFALKPEAAAVCCEAFGHTLAGEKFMVVNLGGGTADISVHQKRIDGSLNNIHAPCGGPWGGILVDENFTKFVTEVFGSEAFTALQSNDMYDYFDMFRDFEVKKRRFEFNSQTNIILRIPKVLKEISENHFHQPLSDRVASLNYGSKVSMRGRDKLGIDSSIMQSWFKDPVSKIVNHIRSLLKDERIKDVSLLVLVGGFAESSCVQQRIKEELPLKQLIVPGEAGLAVLQGAVMLGHKPDIISSSVMDYTYW